MWKKSIIQLSILFSLVILMTSCNSDFERLRKQDDFGLKYEKAMEYYDSGDYYKAQVLLEQVMPFYKGRDEIEKIYFTYAYSHYKMNKFILGSYYFKNFAVTFPNSKYTDEASFMAAYSNYQLSPKYRLDQTYTDKAIDELQLFINTHPKSERVPECNRLIDELRRKKEEKAFAQADLYFRLKDYKAATHTYQTVLKDYPDAQEAERARFMIVQSNYKLAQNTIELTQEERFGDVLEAYKDFTDRHPKSEFTREAEDIYAASTDRIKKLKEATR